MYVCNYLRSVCGVLFTLRLICSSDSDLSLGVFFFFNDTATTEIYTLSLHDALPISLLLIYGGLGLEFGVVVLNWVFGVGV